MRKTIYKYLLTITMFPICMTLSLLVDIAYWIKDKYVLYDTIFNQMLEDETKG